MRSADQYIHTGLEKADEAHQEAHVLLEKWEKFALKMDQRRKLLSIVVSFYKQTEEASERLTQIEKEIKIEQEKAKLLDEKNSEKSQFKTIKINNLANESAKETNTNEELTQRHSDLSQKLADITASSLREGRIVLDKVGQEDFESEHVIKKVI
jgi:hypothetical protein